MSVTNSGLIFSASNFDHAEIPSSIMDLGTNNFTISLWFSLNSSANNKVLFSIKDFFYLQIKNNNELWYLYPYTGGVTESSSAAATLDYNTIYNVVITRYNSVSTSYVSLYFDGTQPHSAYDTNNVSISTYDGEISPANYLNITLYRLDIWKNTGITNVDHIYNAGYTDSLIYGSIEGAIHDESKFGKLSFKTSTDGTLTNLNDRMTILDNGNVGIGLDLPTKKLHVSNDALISNLTVGRGKYELTENTALGVNALNNIAYSNSSANFNTAIGNEALKSATGANGFYQFFGSTYYPSSHNTAVGYKSLSNGYSSTTGCVNNTAVGSLSLSSSTSGSHNTAVGYESLSGSLIGSYCTALGYRALLKNEGSANIGIGAYAGSASGKEVTTGQYNLFLGFNTSFISSTQHNYSTAIGYSSRVSKNYQLVLGGSANPSDLSTYPYPDVYIPGLLGIGTEYPKSKLDVEGSVRIGSTYSGDSSITTDPTNGMIVEGSIGIGTSDPKSKLDVEGSVAIGSSYSGTSAAPTDGMIVEGKVGIGTNDPKSKLDVEGSVAIGSNYSGTSAAPTDGMIVEGKVGIGTNVPKSKLDVEGSVRIGSTYSGNSIISTDPTNGMIVEGSVGIGTIDPKSKLDIEGSVAIGSSYSGSSAAPTNGMIVEGSIGIGTSDPKSKLDVEGSVAIGSSYSGTSAAPTDGMIVEGKVGIGTNDPKSKLDVEGSVAIGSSYSGTSAAPTDGMIVEGSVGIGTNAPKAALQVFNNNGATISSAIATGIRTATLRLGSPYQLSHDAYCAKITSTNDQSIDYKSDLRFYTSVGNNASATERMCISNNGNVGIGTNNPSAPLQVIANSSGSPMTNGIEIFNPTNSSNNHATLSIRTAGSNGGNPFISFDVYGEAGWSAGIDNTDNSFKITNYWDGLATGTTSSTLANTTKFMIDQPTGNVGIGTGTTTPSEKLHVLGNTRLQGIVYIGANNPGGGDNDAAYLRYHVHSGETTELQLVCTNDAADDIGLYPGNTIGGFGAGGIGEVNCYGKVNAPSFNATSDIRHKENIVELKNSLEKITSLRAVNYNLKETPNVKAAGLIAQEVDEIIPEAISKKKEDKWTLDYNTITGYLVDCIKELKKENDELKEDIKRKGDVIVKLHSDVSSIKDILKIRY
jgi:hypothetical protein